MHSKSTFRSVGDSSMSVSKRKPPLQTPYDAPTRRWNKQWEDYSNGLGTEPGPHPDPEHLWNTNRAQWLAENDPDI